jgi:hypothetical protein
MRLRLAVPASLLAMLVAAALPSIGSAAPKHNHGLTINVTPNPIMTGDSVLIYGQLNLKHPGNRLIVLFHRVNPSKHFSPVQTTHTTALGFYEFPRADGVVTTNRNWFVLGPNGSHSRTVHELVAASVTLSASSPTADTNHKLTFSGSVAPNHAGERVYLQSQVGLEGDDWRDIAGGRVGSGSKYSISHRFTQPGDRTLRVVFRGDARNERGVSDSTSVAIQQTQNATFTINASLQNIDEGSNFTLSGVLYAKGSMTTPAGGQTVQLWGHQANAPYTELGTTTTDPMTGAYSFTPAPIHNEVYQVRTAAAPVRRTAQLFEGVRDVVSISASSSSAAVGQKVLFTGTVAPDKAGHVIDLQRLGADGDWHTVKESRVHNGSIYSIGWTLGYPGAKQFRTLVPGGDYNTGGHSAPVTVNAVLVPVTSLPPAS